MRTASSCMVDRAFLAYACLCFLAADLVVFTGDQITGSPDPEETLRLLFAPVVEAGTPFTAVFGNHDEEGAWTREEMMNFITSQPNMIAEAGPENVKGVGNFAIEIGGAFIFIAMSPGNVYVTPRSLPPRLSFLPATFLPFPFFPFLPPSLPFFLFFPFMPSFLHKVVPSSVPSCISSFLPLKTIIEVRVIGGSCWEMSLAHSLAPLASLSRFLLSTLLSF